LIYTEEEIIMVKPFENRIKRIANDLLPLAGLDGKFLPPATLHERMIYYHTPGVSVAVINDFEIEWARGFGLCDSRYKRQVTTNTLFQAGSISKPIFALGIMRLVQEGRLSLDEDVDDYLSTWHIPTNEGWRPRLTLRQLLSHTSGLTVHGFPGYQISEPLPSVAQILNGESPANTVRVEVNILPGLQFRYSGGGITVAQQALVDLLKKPFPQIMREMVFGPLGLANSTYEQSLPEQWAKRAATAHPSKGIPLRGKHHVYPEMAAAGLWTTPTDLARVGVEFLQVLNQREVPALLTKETMETMLSPQLEGQKMGEGDYVGLGFFCSGKEDGFNFGHGGWDEGFIADMRFYKNLGKGAVIMINSNEGYPLKDELMHAIAIEYEWPEAIPERKPVDIPNLSDYTGTYSSKAGTQFKVTLDGEGLVLQYRQQPPLRIFPSSESEFFTKALNAVILFEKDENARICSMTIKQDGNEIKATRAS
jgi:CubicO group peptidase (beta-lactamase class C family)